MNRLEEIYSQALEGQTQRAVFGDTKELEGGE